MLDGFPAIHEKPGIVKLVIPMSRIGEIELVSVPDNLRQSDIGRVFRAQSRSPRGHNTEPAGIEIGGRSIAEITVYALVRVMKSKEADNEE